MSFESNTVPSSSVPMTVPTLAPAARTAQEKLSGAIPAVPLTDLDPKVKPAQNQEVRSHNFERETHEPQTVPPSGTAVVGLTEGCLPRRLLTSNSVRGASTMQQDRHFPSAAVDMDAASDDSGYSVATCTEDQVVQDELDRSMQMVVGDEANLEVTDSNLESS